LKNEQLAIGSSPLAGQSETLQVTKSCRKWPWDVQKHAGSVLVVAVLERVSALQLAGWIFLKNRQRAAKDNLSFVFNTLFLTSKKVCDPQLDVEKGL